MDVHKGIPTTFIFMLDTTKNIYLEAQWLLEK